MDYRYSFLKKTHSVKIMHTICRSNLKIGKTLPKNERLVTIFDYNVQPNNK